MTDKKNDKKNDKRDRELGMSCSITRRDFLNGVALGVGGILAAPHLMASSDSNVFAPEKAPKYYPPALMGMRGNHDGTFTFAHKLRDGKFSPAAPGPEPTGKPMTWLWWAEASADLPPRTSIASLRGTARAS
jgi:hypothetical protein